MRGPIDALGMELDVITMVLLGGGQRMGRQGQLTGVLLGARLDRTLRNISASAGSAARPGLGDRLSADRLTARQ